MASDLETRIELVGTRTARARLVDGVLRVRMPAHWPREHQESTLARFQRWAARQLARVRALPPLAPGEGKRWGEAEFGAYVARLNAETLRAPLAAVRIGRARHTRLAQANTRTGVLTFSRFAIDGMPEQALRYLVLHELAHLFEANHSARFWALVARHEPDWRSQRRIAQAHHARMVEAGNQPAAAEEQPASVPDGVSGAPGLGTADDPPARDAEGHPFGPLFAFVSSR
ncbi:MAG: M48 family metallopeptidase [Candidatus Sericytochromatia bacterium]|nr:M48 family metallopeptidase [Candidatus Sericytochromatia bacterium]